MAKGQKRSNREKKKPKAVKKAGLAAASAPAMAHKGSHAPGRSAKKGA